MQGSDEYGPIGHGWTYSAHPICAAAGVANLELIDELGLMENAATVGAYLKAELITALGDHRHVGEIRGKGMLAAVEFVEDRDDRKFFDPEQKVGPRIAAALAENGVLGRGMPQGDILGFAPPFCLTKEEADIVVSKTVEAVKNIISEL
ncbi:Putrescine--pyruvate aminotransferase [Paenochrobactrum sp. BZR 201-1]